MMSLKEGELHELEATAHGSSRRCRFLSDAQDLMREVVKSLTNADLRLKAGLDKMESAAGDADIKAEIEQTKERLMTLSKGLDKMQETHRDYVIGEGIKMDEVRTKAARVTELEQENSELRRQCEQAERRLPWRYFVRNRPRHL